MPTSPKTWGEEEVSLFVTELISGASPLNAAYTVRPEMSHEEAVVEASYLMTVQATRDALAKLYGGHFEDMTKDQAIFASIAKSLREQAHYLYSNYFEHLDGLRMKKYTDAFMTLTKWYPPTEAGTDTPVAQFWKQFFETNKPTTEVKDGHEH
jgi:hypothetical protein